MLIDEIRNIKGTKKELKKFGLTMGALFLFLGIVLCVKGRPIYPYGIVLALAFMFLGLLIPHLLKPFHFLWMALATVMGVVMTRIILVLLFYLIVTPVGIIMRLARQDSLNQIILKESESYWVKKEKKKIDNKDYERQF